MALFMKNENFFEGKEIYREQFIFDLMKRNFT